MILQKHSFLIKLLFSILVFNTCIPVFIFATEPTDAREQIQLVENKKSINIGKVLEELNLFLKNFDTKSPLSLRTLIELLGVIIVLYKWNQGQKERIEINQENVKKYDKLWNIYNDALLQKAEANKEKIKDIKDIKDIYDSLVSIIFKRNGVDVIPTRFVINNNSESIIDEIQQKINELSLVKNSDLNDSNQENIKQILACLEALLTDEEKTKIDDKINSATVDFIKNKIENLKNQIKDLKDTIAEKEKLIDYHNGLYSQEKDDNSKLLEDSKAMINKLNHEKDSQIKELQDKIQLLEETKNQQENQSKNPIIKIKKNKRKKSSKQKEENNDQQKINIDTIAKVNSVDIKNEEENQILSVTSKENFINQDNLSYNTNLTGSHIYPQKSDPTNFISKTLSQSFYKIEVIDVTEVDRIYEFVISDNNHSTYYMNKSTNPDGNLSDKKIFDVVILNFSNEISDQHISNEKRNFVEKFFEDRNNENIVVRITVLDNKINNLSKILKTKTLNAGFSTFPKLEKINILLSIGTTISKIEFSELITIGYPENKTLGIDGFLWWCEVNEISVERCIVAQPDASFITWLQNTFKNNKNIIKTYGNIYSDWGIYSQLNHWGNVLRKLDNCHLDKGGNFLVSNFIDNKKNYVIYDDNGVHSVALKTLYFMYETLNSETIMSRHHDFWLTIVTKENNAQSIYCYERGQIENASEELLKDPIMKRMTNQRERFKNIYSDESYQKQIDQIKGTLNDTKEKTTKIISKAAEESKKIALNLINFPYKDFFSDGYNVIMGNNSNNNAPVKIEVRNVDINALMENNNTIAKVNSVDIKNEEENQILSVTSKENFINQDNLSYNNQNILNHNSLYISQSLYPDQLKQLKNNNN